MKIGQCWQCGTVMGRKSANGRFSYNKNKTQVSIKIEVLPEKFTELHVPICVDCAKADKFSFSALKENLKKDKSAGRFFLDYPDSTYVSYVEESDSGVPV